MKSRSLIAALLIAVPSVVLAHVTVRPRESEAAAEVQYLVRVPTEGSVATTSVRLEVPDGITVLEVVPMNGATSTVQRDGARIVSVTWTKTIEPEQMAEFAVRAKNPAGAATLPWKAHQHFADGTVTDWVGPSGDRRPAPVTVVTAGPLAK